MKTRLSVALTPGERREFAKLMLSHLLGVLKEAGLARSTYLVSSDGDALEMGKVFGAKGVREVEDRGVNEAVRAGLAAVGDVETVLVLPGDLPLISTLDVADVKSLRESGFDVVIAPSVGFNGTNALAFSPKLGFPLSYDADSFWTHLATAATMGLRVAVSCKRGLMLDIDSREDLADLSRESLMSESVSFARRKVR